MKLCNVIPEASFSSEHSELFEKLSCLVSIFSCLLDASPKVYPRAGGGWHDNKDGLT